MITMTENNNYEYFETTADIGVTACGESLENAFINSALGTMNLITSINQIKPKITMEAPQLIYDVYKVDVEGNPEKIMLQSSMMSIRPTLDKISSEGGASNMS